MKSLFDGFEMTKAERMKAGAFIGAGIFLLMSSFIALAKINTTVVVGLIFLMLAATCFVCMFVYKLLISLYHLKQDNDLK